MTFAEHRLVANEHRISVGQEARSERPPYQHYRPATQQLVDACDRELDGDRRFFKQRPRRAYRLRRAFPAETEVLLAISGRLSATLPPGHRAYIAIPQLAPVTRMRLSVELPNVADAGSSEHAAQHIYDALANALPKAREIEATLRMRVRP